MPHSSQHGLKKAIGALKDSTKVGLAMVNSDHKGMEVVILKATNHEEEVPKEKYVLTILNAVANRVDAAFCIHTLLKRLAKTHTWTVALKTLIVIHRILKHDPTFHQELINFRRDRGLRLNVAHLKDDSSPETWNYSFWVREYALYLEKRLECFHVLQYDVDKDQSRNKRLNTPSLLNQLPVLQELLHRLLKCKPVGAAFSNRLIHYVLSIIAGESVKLYIAITDGILNLVDKYFEMQHHHAVKALEIYREAGVQASQLSEFFVICRGLPYGQGQNYLKIKPLPESFLFAMEEYVKDTPQVLALPYTPIEAIEGAAPIETPSAPVSDLLTDDNRDTSDQPDSDPKKAVGKLDIDDLICFEEPSENDPLALAIVESENPPYAENVVGSASASTGWELALCNDAPISNEAAVADNKMSDVSNGLTPQSLLPTNQQTAFSFGQASSNPFDVNYSSQGSFYGSGNILPETNVQMSAMPQHLTYIMKQQPPMAMVGYHSIKPSVGANYNQVPMFYGGSNIAPSTDMQIEAMALQQTDLNQHPALATVGYNSAKPSGNPFDM